MILRIAEFKNENTFSISFAGSFFRLNLSISEAVKMILSEKNMLFESLIEKLTRYRVSDEQSLKLLIELNKIAKK